MSPPAKPMLYTAAPSTWPTGSKPTDLIAANSWVLSAEPQVPLCLISAIRASAAGGKAGDGPSPNGWGAAISGAPAPAGGGGAGLSGPPASAEGSGASLLAARSLRRRG